MTIMTATARSLSRGKTPFSVRFRPAPLTLGLAVVLAGYLVVLATHAAYAVGGSDTSGYANLARSLLTGRIKTEIRELETFRVPENFAPIFAPLAYTTLGKNGEVTRIVSPF
jgi:hypothetical protein